MARSLRGLPIKRALVALCASLMLACLPVSVADGKKTGGPPGQAGGQANGSGQGHGSNGNGQDSNGTGHDSMQAPAGDGASRPSAGSGPAQRDGNGNSGNGRSGSGSGQGSGRNPKRQQPSSAPRPEAPAPSSSSGTSGASGNSGSSSSGTPQPAPVAGTPPAAEPAPRANGRPGRQQGSGSRRRARRAARGSGGARRSAASPGSPTRSAGADASPAPAGATSPDAAGDDAERSDERAEPESARSPVVRTLERVVKVVPTFVWAIIAVLAVLLLVAAAAWFLLARTTRFLRRQRESLLGEIGVLQGALLPNVPAELNRLKASVAYRPAEGLAAGGDFYDAFALEKGKVGIVVGDVAGHGKEALMHTSLLRYTMRAYLEANLEPRVALQLAGRALDRGFDTLATVVLAVYDPAAHMLRYASAGHPPPIFLGEADHVPVTRGSSPPIGAGLPTGLRQTTVSLPGGSAVCFFTDGLIEARRDNKLIGRLGLAEIIAELGPDGTAKDVLEAIADRADVVSDDMAACMFRVPDWPRVPSSDRVEELEVFENERLEVVLPRFLGACGVEQDDIDAALDSARRTRRQFGGAVIRVAFGKLGPRVEINPANVESLAAAYSRIAAR